ncbi:hypothetical protein C8R44DRAFT_881292 [Mycena epipterygia]|nr:hypothetical protein C8R44DRAFT_881292 [Mycena epipterygia]
MDQAMLSPESLTPLQKGKACVNSAEKLFKCDGRKPLCGQCAKSTTFGDCEYTDSGNSQGQMLEEQISILQARIEKLEKPNPALPLLQSSPSSTSQISPSISPSNTMGLGPLLSHFYLQQTSGTAPNQDVVNSMPTDLPFIVLQALVHNFLHNASCFGFFLDTQAFHNAITSNSGSTLPPVLLNVMYLWGVHLSKDARITTYESAFLAHALRSTASSLSGTHPRTILHSIRLVYYFIRNTRFLEGRYHTSAAVSMAVSSGLHRIRATHVPDGGLELPEALPPPKDAAEDGERISAFWSVLNLNNAWAGADGSPSNISYRSEGLQIDTPWPLDRDDYVQQSSGTISNFLADIPDRETSGPALHAKAGVLFEEATRLSARHRTMGMQSTDPEFWALDRIIDTFNPSLPSINCKAMLVVHTLAHGAMIQLHSPFAKESMASRAKTLAAARSIAAILAQTDVPNVELIDPVLALLWASTCLVIIAEIDHQQNQGGANQPDSESLEKSLDVVVAAMQHFAPHCRLMAAQIDAVRHARDGGRE